MGNFKDFDLDLKISKADGKEGGIGDLSISNCTCPKICAETMNGCRPTDNCSLSDMTDCIDGRQALQEKNDLRRC